jgi:3-oxoacyl-[acyl-carrier-protein] synthase III
MLDATPTLDPTSRSSWNASRSGTLALRPAAIGAVGMAVPAGVVTNEPIAERFGIDPRWIVERTGVRERRVLAEDETLLGLAADAAEATLERAGLEPAALDQVLVATMSHDRLTPNLAPLVAQEIGASGAGALDVGAACTGFVGALAMAVAQVETRRAETVLVVGAERLSTLTDHDDRATAALFGDGAGAALVRAAAGPGFGPFVLGSDGARAEVVRAERAEALIRMQGQDTFREAVRRMAEATLAAIDAAAVSLAEVDLFVYHQANARILRALAQRLMLAEDRVLECISRYGNTSAASIPIALATARGEERIQPGDRVLLAAFGGGLTWGATVLEWEA